MKLIIDYKNTTVDIMMAASVIIYKNLSKIDKFSRSLITNNNMEDENMYLSDSLVTKESNHIGTGNNHLTLDTLNLYYGMSVIKDAPIVGKLMNIDFNPEQNIYGLMCHAVMKDFLNCSPSQEYDIKGFLGSQMYQIGKTVCEIVDAAKKNSSLEFFDKYTDGKYNVFGVCSEPDCFIQDYKLVPDYQEYDYACIEDNIGEAYVIPIRKGLSEIRKHLSISGGKNYISQNNKNLIFGKPRRVKI